MQALVVGASGQIGGHLVRLLEEAGHEVLGTHHSVEGQTASGSTIPLSLDDLRDDDSTEAALSAASSRWLGSRSGGVAGGGEAESGTFAPSLVLLSAGWTWVDGNEDDPAASLQRNCTAALCLARWAVRAGARFATYSTDYVFDGERGDYAEGDATAPLNVYGRSKLAMEQALATEVPGALVLRTSTVYGPERQGKNFVYQLVKRVSGGLPFRVPTDQVASPSYAPDVAAVTLALLEAGEQGLWHVVGPDAVDRGGFARAVCAEWKLDPAGIEFRSTAELEQRARRPLAASLSTRKLLATDLSWGERRVPVRGIEAGLAAMRAAIAAGEGSEPR